MRMVLWLALLLPVLAMPAMAADAEKIATRIVTVSGRGEVTVPTTITRVSLGVEARAKTAQEAHQEAAKRSAAVVALLKSRGVEKLQTTGISLSQDYSYSGSKREAVGYAAANLVMFRMETEKVGTLLDDAVKAGASRIDGISFVAADEVLAAAKREAIKKAVKDAQGQGEAALEALGLKAREVVGVQLDNAQTPVPVMRQGMLRAKMASSDVAETPVVGGEQNVDASVTLQITY